MKTHRLILTIVAIAMIGVIATRLAMRDTSPVVVNTQVNESAAATNENTNQAVIPDSQPVNTNTPAAEPPAPIVEATVVLPIKNFYNRITKKHFGTFITKANSPVQPERFSGYHAGSDAEAPETSDVGVYAIADGTVVLKRDVDGYGGVMMIEHVVDGETVTALYGHIRLSSVTLAVGSTVKKKDRIAFLGTGYSTETDNERKHLHFALLKGRSTKLAGYVTSQSALSPWYDPEVWLKDKQAVEPSS